MKKENEFIDIKTVQWSEARIAYIKKQLESLLSVVQLEYKGRPVSVDGFRLKNLGHWKVPKCDDFTFIEDMLEYIGRMNRCRSRCHFCFFQGNPKDSIFNSPYQPPEEEILTRLRYYSSPDPTMLFPTWVDFEEILGDERTFRLLCELRKITDDQFVITTAGAMLTGEFIDRLRLLEPLILRLSLNLSDIKKRQALMRDRRAVVGVKALPLLSQAGISYWTSIVGWFGLDQKDVRDTIEYAVSHDTMAVNVMLGSFTQYNAPPEAAGWHDLWLHYLRIVEEMRENVSCPIFIVPALFEENRRGTGWKEARVLGTIRNSPASKSGIVSDDIIEAVEGRKPLSRPDLLKELCSREIEGLKTTVMVKRGKHSLSFSLSPEDSAYPYKSGALAYGILMADGLWHRELEKLITIIREHNSSHTVVATSVLMKPSLLEALDELDIEARSGSRIAAVTVTSSYHGGNIIVGDLMACEDYIASLGTYIKESSERPDLIIIPGSGFGDWKFDIAGKSCTVIERALKIPVEVLENRRIFF
ncbi:MAG: radical SAM protein [Candidatus Xenobiia bacterium LiM19]